MNQKFEKFKSKEISKTESEKVIGAHDNVFDCIAEGELKANTQCAIQYFDDEDKREFCVFQKSFQSFLYCADLYSQ